MQFSIRPCTALLGVFSFCFAAFASADEPTPLNIGYVVYAKGDEPGTLTARFRHAAFGAGTGAAVGGSGDDYTGDYVITYAGASGEPYGDFDLNITRDGDDYFLTWRQGGKIVSQGIGVATPDGLVAGWRRLSDE